jgi:hypothetical protein
LGPQCSNPNQELRDRHQRPGCSEHIHVLSGTLVKEFLGKYVHFCPPCHEKRDGAIYSPLAPPPNANLNLMLHGSPNTPGRRCTTPKQLAMTEPKTEDNSPYSVANPPTQSMDTAFFEMIESIDNNNSSIWPLSYEELQAKTITSLFFCGKLLFLQLQGN